MIIRAFRFSTPDAQGYPDKVRVYNSDAGNMEVYRSDRFRTNPNPYQPSTQKPWGEVYAQIAPTDPAGIPWECIQSPKHGVCIALAGLGPVATTAPDPNNHGQMEALDVEIHCGFSLTWPGSMACQTVHPQDWPVFIGHFFLGDKGVFILTDETGGDPEQTVIQQPST